MLAGHYRTRRFKYDKDITVSAELSKINFYVNQFLCWSTNLDACLLRLPFLITRHLIGQNSDSMIC